MCDSETYDGNNEDHYHIEEMNKQIETPKGGKMKRNHKSFNFTNE